MEKQGTSATRAKNKYNEKSYDNIHLVVPKGEKERIAAYAKKHSPSLNAYIYQLILDDMDNPQK